MNRYLAKTYFVSRGLFLGLVYSKMFGYVGSDSLLSSLLGSLLGLFLIFIINKIRINSLFHKTIFFLYLSLIIILGIVIGENFCSYFFLSKMPRILIVIPAMIICFYIAMQSKRTLNILANMELPVSLIIIILTILVLLPHFNYQYFLPLFNHSFKNIAKAAFIFGVYSSTPNILLCEDNIPLKNHLINYLFTCFINVIICTLIIGILKPSLLNVYSFPEYMALKNVKIFGFIENIENLLAAVWLFDLFIMVSLANKKIYELFNSKILTFGYISILTFITSYIIIPNYNLVLIIYYYASLGLLIITVLLCFKSNGKYR